MKTLIIGGAGLTGLSAAWFYRQKFPDHRIILTDPDSQPGGNLRSEWRGDFLFEYGPRGVLKNAHAFFHLLHSSGAWDKLKPGRKTASIRFLWYKGRMHQLGGNPLAMLTNPELLKLIPSLFRESSVPSGTSEDESIYDFFSRRIGQAATDFLVDGFITGVWAGDSRQLSIRSAFPTIWAAEKAAGSIRKGLKATRDQRKADQLKQLADFPHPDPGPSRFFSLQDGIQSIASHLITAARLQFHPNSTISEITPAGPQSEVTLADGTVLMADQVVLTGKASSTATIVEHLNPTLAGLLRSVTYAPVTVVNLGYPFIRKAASGFGFLIPSAEKSTILGIIYNSGTFERVAPAGGACFTVMFGGAHHPTIGQRSDADLISMARDAMAGYLGVQDTPTELGIRRWESAIPQYRVGHEQLIARIRQEASGLNGIHLLGNWSGGIGVNDCVASSARWARSL